MTAVIFNDVSLWHHHHELCQTAITLAEEGDPPLFISCSASCLGCPANPLRNPVACRACIQQAAQIHTNLSKHNIQCLFVDDLPCSQPLFEPDQLVSDLELSISATFAEIVSDSFFRKNHYLYSWFKSCISNDIKILLKRLSTLLRSYPEISEYIVWNGRRTFEQLVTRVAQLSSIEHSSVISAQSRGRYHYKRGWRDVNSIAGHTMLIHEYLYNYRASPSQTEVRDQYFSFSSATGGLPSSFSESGFYMYSKNYRITESFAHRIEQIKRTQSVISVFPGTFLEYLALPGYTEDPLFDNHYQALDYLIEMSVDTPHHYVLRFHPNQRELQGHERNAIKRLVRKASALSNWTVILPDSNESSYGLLSHSVCAIAIGSSIGVDALLYKIPVLFIGRNWFESLPSLIRPSTRAQIKDFLLDLPTYSDTVDADTTCFANILVPSCAPTIRYRTILNGIRGSNTKITKLFRVGIPSRLASLHSRLFSLLYACRI